MGWGVGLGLRVGFDVFVVDNKMLKPKLFSLESLCHMLLVSFLAVATALIGRIVHVPTDVQEVHTRPELLQTEQDVRLFRFSGSDLNGVDLAWRC